MLKLIGSTTSPYVRKVRLLLHELNHEYEFEQLKALSNEGEAALKSYGPLLRIPILIDEDKKIFDSSIIVEYLLEKRKMFLTVDEKLKLKLIDELCDCGVDLVKQRAWGIDKMWADKRSQKCLLRLNLILDALEDDLQSLSSLQKDWLHCALDWLVFRSILKFDGKYQGLEAFYRENLPLEKFLKTKPHL